MTGSIDEHVASLDADQLPSYIYDLAALRRHVGAIRSRIPADVELFYAAKANPDAVLLRTLAPLVDGFEASSAGELDHIMASAPGARVAVGGPGKSPADLRAAIRHGVDRVHVESVTELRRLSQAAAESGRRIDILLRANLVDVPPAIDDAPLAMAGRATPFGMDDRDISDCLRLLSGDTHLRLAGLHAHVASGLHADAHLAVCASILRYAEQIERAHDVQLQEVNLGGGMAVSYDPSGQQFDWDHWTAGIEALRLRGHQHRTLRIEPGRALTAWCGSYVTEILDIKRSHGEEVVIVAGGTHHLRTPAARGHDQPAHLVPVAASSAPRVTHEHAQLVGQLCTPKDVLSRRAPLHGAGLGDRVVLSLAGAYAWNISHHDFLMHPAPTVHYLDDDVRASHP
ncbi:alanine racemase [Microbacterium sp. NPDC058342]|uniref:alanine racemase n=1 Tax=Microbacterium sp. NPDC058342 TaxID=3346454 RepID=UPI003647617C